MARNHAKSMPRPADAVAQTDQPVLFAYREVSKESTGFSLFQLLYRCSVRGPGTILKELWTKEVNIPEVKTSYEYVTELRERLKDSLKLAKEEYRSPRNATRANTTRRPSPDI